MGVGGPNGEDDACACERMAMQVAGCEGAEGCLGGQWTVVEAEGAWGQTSFSTIKIQET